MPLLDENHRLSNDQVELELGPSILSQAGVLPKIIEIEKITWAKEPEIALIPDACHSSPAFLMYTSGSTSQPKGVIVSHHNLVANICQISSRAIFTKESRAIMWIPPYHDMRLIGAILTPLFMGYPCELASRYNL